MPSENNKIGVFSYGMPTQTALLNWPMDKHDVPENFYKMAQGYQQAAMMILKDLLCENRNKRADKISFPLLFLLNQSIELYLKSILLYLYLLNGKTLNELKIKTQLKGHEIETLIGYLCDETRKLDKAININDWLKELLSYSKELSNLASDKQKKKIFDSMRYPADLDLQGFFYADTYENVPLNLARCYEQFDIIYQRLDGMQGKFAQALEAKREGKNGEIDF